MPGTALVTIGENQWNVEVATTITELATGLSGRASIPAGTGMLFILPVTQVVTVQTNEMLFPLDIIFIKDNLVLDITQNIEPGNLVEEATPCDSFLEINAGEAGLVEVGDAVNVEITTPPPAPGFDFSSILSFAIPLVVLGLVSGMLIEKKIEGGHHSNPGNEKSFILWDMQMQSSLGSFKAKEEAEKYADEHLVKDWRKWIEIRPFSQKEPGSSGHHFSPGIITIPKLPEEARGDFLFYEYIRDLSKLKKVSLTEYEVRELWEGWKEQRSFGHSIHGEPRQRLVEKYGSWQVSRAESVCPEGDVVCVEREAKRLTEVLRTRYGSEVEYVTITDPGKTVLHVGDVVSVIAVERENLRVRKLGEKEATWTT